MYSEIFWLFFAFQLKHLVVDWLYQPPYMYRNKGNIQHPGGYLHAGFHLVVTYLLLTLWGFDPVLAGWLAFAEGIAHYAIDFTKVNVSRMQNWGPTTSENFWRATGIDQFAHQICYIAIIAILMN